MHKNCTENISQTFLAATVQLKSKLSPSRKTRLVSRETCLETNETSLEFFSRVHWKYQYFAFIGIRNLLCVLSVSHHIVSISAVDTIFILISNACTMCVLRILKRPILFHIHPPNFFYSSQTCLTFSFCKYMHNIS